MYVKDTVPRVDAFIPDFYGILQDVNAANASLERHDVQTKISVRVQMEGNGVRTPCLMCGARSLIHER